MDGHDAGKIWAKLTCFLLLDCPWDYWIVYMIRSATICISVMIMQGCCYALSAWTLVGTLVKTPYRIALVKSIVNLL
jgi:hypothetical protein